MLDDEGEFLVISFSTFSVFIDFLITQISPDHKWKNPG